MGSWDNSKITWQKNWSTWITILWIGKALEQEICGRTNSKIWGSVRSPGQDVRPVCASLKSGNRKM